MVCLDAAGRPAACQSVPLSKTVELLRGAGFHGADLAAMAAVVMAESSGFSNAVNPSNPNAVGLVQIDLSAHPDVTRAQAMDPQFAARYAYRLYSGRQSSQGWAHRFDDWASYTSGAYRTFLSKAQTAVADVSLLLANPFGLLSTTYQRHEPRYLQQDRGLVPDAVTELNYGLPYGTRAPVHLPQGTWTLVSQTQDPKVGGEQVWKESSGAVIGLLHLSTLWHGPATVQGGTAVALSGWPLDPAYGNGVAGPGNAHLAVIMNSAAAAAFDTLGTAGSSSASSGGTGGPGFPGVPNPLDALSSVPNAIGSAVSSVEAAARRAAFVLLGLLLVLAGLALLAASSKGLRGVAETVAVPERAA